MGAVVAYIRNIKDTAVSVFDGMTITFSYLIQKPVTIQYPNRLITPVQQQVAERFRGFLQVDYNLCTSCNLCAKECPIDCIELDGVKVPGRKGKSPYYFFIDMGKCMYCGFCVQVCPTDAIYFTREFEGSATQVGDMVFSYVPQNIAEDFIRQNLKAQREKGSGGGATPESE